MEAVIEATGMQLCDSSAVRAVGVRRLDSLPYAAAFGSCDIGEAMLEDGRRVMITWGRNLTREQQFWFAHHSTHSPVWCGASDGSCELILGDTFASTPADDWLWLGIRITRESDVNWRPVGGES